MPRPRTQDIGGTVLGALLGGGIGGPPGALLGGALGSVANTSKPMPLDAAIREALKERKLTLANLTREAKNRLTCVFASAPNAYWLIMAEAFIEHGWTADDLDDALYDETITQIDCWVVDHGW